MVHNFHPDYTPGHAVLIALESTQECCCPGMYNYYGTRDRDVTVYHQSYKEEMGTMKTRNQNHVALRVALLT